MDLLPLLLGVALGVVSLATLRLVVRRRSGSGLAPPVPTGPVVVGAAISTLLLGAAIVRAALAG